MTLLRPLEKMTAQLGGEAGGVLVKDLLCGEALSPNTHCPARHAGLHHDDHNNAPLWLGTSRLSPFNPMRGSSFPSKYGDEYSPRSGYPPKIFCADDVAVAVITARSDPPLRRKPVAVVADSISIPWPTFAELGEAMCVLQEREAQMAYRLTARYVDALMESDLPKSSFSEVCSLRRDGVFHIFKLVEALRLRILIAAHAVAYLDRFLSTSMVSTVIESTTAMQFQYIAAACVSIAAKMDATAAPSLASLSRFSGEGTMMSEAKLREMEAVVLQVLGWKLLGVTTSDFVDNMIAHLPLSGVPSALVQAARRRADEFIHFTLTEVEFLDFEQSIVSLCVMQCILDETLPLQAALLMPVLRTVLVVDTLAAQQCYKTLVDMVVEPRPKCSA